MGQDENSTDAWHKWIVENQAKCLLYARQQSRSEADAQDILQEAILSLWQDSQENSPTELPSAGKVFTAIRFRALNRGRGQDRRNRREKEYMYLEYKSAFQEQLSPTGDELQLLTQAIRTLPEAQAEVLTLKIWGELTFREISDICQCSINTITARYRQALEKLQKTLKGNFCL